MYISIRLLINLFFNLYIHACMPWMHTIAVSANDALATTAIPNMASCIPENPSDNMKEKMAN
jgi:hypothetical protein